MTSTKVLFDATATGDVARVTLNDPPGNVLDIETIDALRVALARASRESHVKAIVLTGSGANFSYGASISEHRPGEIDRALPRFHDLFRDLFDIGKPLVAVVRGQCLGGGLELAIACNWIFASPDACFGLPEIRLGVFPPLGSLLLPGRVGRATAEMLCLTGRVLRADEARSCGLVDHVAADPDAEAGSWIDSHLRPHSAMALHYATRAVRVLSREDLYRGLEELERMYLRELMRSEDAREGTAAFLEKRSPGWRDR